MAMQSSGAISLNQVTLELRNTSLSTISMNDTRARLLSKKSSGQVSFSDFYNRNYDNQGQSEYTTVGTHSWTCPSGVTQVSAVCIGGGGGGYHSGNAGPGGGGGGLGWKNNISVTPGSTYTVVVGSAGVGNDYGLVNGGDSYFINTSTVKGGGGQSPNFSVGTAYGGNYVGDGGGSGGSMGHADPTAGGGGAGAGGYTANGNTNAGGSGGAGGAGDSQGLGGGGVSIFGQGASGASYGCYNCPVGGGGSGGQSGQGKNGGLYGGGGGGADSSGSSGYGAQGAVRIIWGETRSFPATNTGNVTAGEVYT